MPNVESTGRPRWIPISTGLAGVGWVFLIGLLVSSDLARGPNLLSPLHLFFHGVALLTGVLTFWPLERQFDLVGLTIEGTLGSWLFLVALAIVPAPTGTLLDPPDTPVYTLMLLAVFLTIAAIARPIIAALSRRWLALRAWALDQRRVRRESYEVGFVAAAVLALAALRALDPIRLIALVTVVVLIEIIFLSLIGVES